MIWQQTISIKNEGRGTIEITRDIQEAVTASGIKTGIAQLFLHHTSASLLLCENADPDVRHDMETFMRRLVPDGDPEFVHTMEGPDDMPAHVRSVLTGCDLGFPITDGRPALGTWQGVYLWEHRHSPHTRRLTVTLYGE